MPWWILPGRPEGSCRPPGVSVQDKEAVYPTNSGKTWCYCELRAHLLRMALLADRIRLMRTWSTNVRHLFPLECK